MNDEWAASAIFRWTPHLWPTFVCHFKTTAHGVLTIARSNCLLFLCHLSTMDEHTQTHASHLGMIGGVALQPIFTCLLVIVLLRILFFWIFFLFVFCYYSLFNFIVIIINFDGEILTQLCHHQTARTTSISNRTIVLWQRTKNFERECISTTFDTSNMAPHPWNIVWNTLCLTNRWTRTHLVCVAATFWLILKPSICLSRQSNRSTFIDHISRPCASVSIAFVTVISFHFFFYFVRFIYICALLFSFVSIFALISLISSRGNALKQHTFQMWKCIDVHVNSSLWCWCSKKFR